MKFLGDYVLFSIKVTLFTVSLGFLELTTIAPVELAVAEPSLFQFPANPTEPQSHLCGYPLTKSKVPCLIRKLQSSDYLTRRFAAWELGETGEIATESVPYLINLLKKDRGKWERVHACIALGKIGLPIIKVLASLRLALEDSDSDVRDYAANALGIVADKIQNLSKPNNLLQTDLKIAISELQLSLQLLKSPNINFNREPIERVTTSLNILKARTK